MGKESIFTIPINAAFDFTKEEGVCECPVCLLYYSLENNEVERITGAAMMEPDVRIQTNKLGFCSNHLKMMLETDKKLPVGLMMESLLAEQTKNIFPSFSIDGMGNKMTDKLDSFTCSCYVCSRINDSFSKMIDNMLYMYETDPDFEVKYREQKYFCLVHFNMLLNQGRDTLPKKLFKNFLDTTVKITSEYMKELNGDVSWFCKKFDYRYQNESWKNSKDSLTRTQTFLSGGINDKKIKFKI